MNTNHAYYTYNNYTIQVWQSTPGPMGRYSARITSPTGQATTITRNAASEARAAAKWYVDHQAV